MTNTPTAPVFVIGYMRSGTTLLHSILAAHSTIFASQAETKYFEYQPIFHRLYPDLSDDGQLENLLVTTAYIITNGQLRDLKTAPTNYRPPDYDLPPAVLAAMMENAHHTRTYGHAFRAVFDQLTYQAGKTCWIEKTPQHTYFIEDILRSVPEARFVEIVRDPRAVLASKKKRQEVVKTSPRFMGEEQRRQRLQRVYDPLWDTLAWRLAIRAGRQAHHQHPDRITTIQYEQLIAEPEAIIRQVCEFLALTFEPEILNVTWMSTGEGVKADQRGFHTESLDQWKQVLTPAEVALSQRLAAAQMQQFGYTAAAVPLVRQLTIPLILLKSGFEFFQRLYKRWRLGGTAFMMNTVENYWIQLRKLLHHR